MHFRNKYLITLGLCTAMCTNISSGYGLDSNSRINQISVEHHNSPWVLVSEARAKTAQKFIKGVTDRGIGFLADPDMSLEKRKIEFSKLLKDSFDIKTIARFSLGRYWRIATKEEKKEYLDLFEKMILEVYSKRFGDYQGQDLKINSARAEGKSDAIVTTMIVPENGPEIRVDWRVRNKKGRNKIIDIMVEGVSMAVTQRSDFASVIQRGGGKVGVLLAHLKQ